MSKLPSLPLFVDDYEAASAHLSLEEDGCYTRLLRLCWRTPTGTIPHDHDWIRRRMRVDQQTYDRVIVAVIDEFFVSSKATNLPDLLPPDLLEQVPSEDRLLSPRLLKEYHRALRLSAARREAGSAGGNAKARKTAKNDIGKATNLPEQKASEALAPIPIPIPIPVDTPEDKSSGGGAAKRGTRLPDDFVMPDEWKALALAKGHSQRVVDREGEKFTLHWQTKTGRDATKTDWRKTWQKWVLGIQPERGGAHQQNLGGGGGDFTPISGPC